MVNHFPLEGSGSGTYTKNIAMALVALGHEVCIVMPENSSAFPQIAGVKLHPVYFSPEDGSAAPDGALPFDFPCFTTHPRSTTTFSDLDAAQFEAYMQAFSHALEDEAREFGPDVVHGQHVWVLSALAARLGLPLVLTAHGTDLMGYAQWPQLRAYPDECMDAASAVVTISKDNHELVETTFPQHAHKALMMSNGYSSQVFFQSHIDRAELLGGYGVAYSGERFVLFAGKLTHFKGVDVLLDACALYEQQTDDIITVIAGDGAERGNLEEQSARLGLTNVHFIGNVSQSELQKLYACADVDLVPSRNEAFGLVAIEAMACGTPVVASNGGGLPDFVNSSVGALVAPEDPDDLARGIVETLDRALANRAWRDDIASYAAGNYSQAVIIRELDELYRTVA